MQSARTRVYSAGRSACFFWTAIRFTRVPVLLARQRIEAGKIRKKPTSYVTTCAFMTDWDEKRINVSLMRFQTFRRSSPGKLLTSPLCRHFPSALAHSLKRVSALCATPPICNAAHSNHAPSRGQPQPPPQQPSNRHISDIYVPGALFAEREAGDLRDSNQTLSHLRCTFIYFREEHLNTSMMRIS